jgi:outer membrane receptor for ferrienterochelin and colicins
MVYPLLYQASLRQTKTHIRHKRVASALVAVLMSVTAAPSQAQSAQELADLDLEQLMEMRIDSVYGASKYDQRVTRAPSSISVITADEIQRFGHRTLNDVLQSVRGLYVSDDRNYTFLGVRGFHRPTDYNTRVLVMVDGHRINDNVYDSGSTGREGMVDVELIERVEVIRGPSSSIYGSSAFLGVINVVTKDGSHIDGMEVSAEAGSLETYKSRLTYGGTTENGAQWLFSTSYFSSEGRESLYFPEFDQRISDDPRARNDGIALDLDAEEAKNFFSNLSYGGWSASIFVSERDKDVPTASYGTLFNDPREWTNDQRSYLDINYKGAINDALSFQVRGFYDRYQYRGAYPYDYAMPGDPPDEVVSKDRTLGEWFGTEWQLTQQVGAHRFMIGGEYRKSLREHQSMYDDVVPRDYYWSDDRTSDTLGLFAQGEITLTEKLMLNGGVRFDQFSANSVDTVNPRLALIYHPNARSAFKVLYGQAFRAPNAFEAYYSEVQRTRPPLKAETIDTYELVYERYIGTQYRISVSAYNYQIDGLIAQAATEDEITYFDNVDDVSAKGLELEAEGKFESGALVRGSYALQRARDDSTAQALSSSPRHLAKLNVSVPLFNEAFTTSLELQYHGSVKTLDGEHVDDFLTTNLTLFTKRFSKGLEVSMSIYNALDATYGFPGSEDHLQSVILQNGRTMQARFVYGF